MTMPCANILEGFSKKEYSDENIDFWVDVEKFRACTLTALDSNKASDEEVARKNWEICS